VAQIAGCDMEGLFEVSTCATAAAIPPDCRNDAAGDGLSLAIQ
jgi:hypothetical protein